MTTEQLQAWTGAFGDDYVDRNPADVDNLRKRRRAWARMLAPLDGRPPRSILEVGANIGANLIVLRDLTDARLAGVEPNDRARAALAASGAVAQTDALAGTAQALPAADGAFEMVFTSGVLIHIGPNDLEQVAREMYRVSSRYILVSEYFSVNSEQILYRGQKDLLYKRDFGSFFLDLFSDLYCVDYGFFWKRLTGIDNLTW